MKKVHILLLIVSNIFIQNALGVFSYQIIPQKNTRQLIIHFASNPHDQEEHKKWNQIIHQAKDQLNDFLTAHGYIRPIKRQNESAGVVENVLDTMREWYYSLVFREFSSKYPHKRNEVFFTRMDHDFGNFALHIPDGVSERIVVKQLKKILKKQENLFHIDKDVQVRIARHIDIGLEGVSLTLQEVEAVKRAQRNVATKTDEEVLKALEARTKKLRTIIEQAFWHQRIPTTGLRLEAPFYPPAYPFIPHMFSLWQLAPKKGAGIKVAVIDTGVAAASFKDKTQYKKNIDLTLSPGMLHENLNIVSHNGLDPIEQLVNVAYPYIQPQLFNEIEVQQQVIDWVHDYLINQNTDKLIEYLKAKGIRGLFNSQGQLTAGGKEAVATITTGPLGIVPRKKSPALHFATMQEPFEKKIIQQLLPVVPITDKRVTYITGHGSHTYGLVAAEYQGIGLTPEDDIGVCGLAPNASAFMIKAFGDDGSSNKSTLVAALKKAILYNADVASLSLKIADNLDLTATLSKLLEKMVNLIPYVVAASGNDGDPDMKSYVGKVEAYPAQFDTVAFDVGSFGFKDMQCPINVFSQYEPNRGPKFAAPGFNILSSALVPGQTEDSMYVFMDGTSMATPMMTGFVALMLAEFKDDFTQDELLNVCYTSVFKMHDNADWNKKVLLGALDMRTALFVLHCLRQARQNKSLNMLSFNKLLVSIYEIIFAQPREYGQANLNGANFAGDFMTYFAKAQANKKDFEPAEYFMPQTIDEAISYVINSLLAAHGTSRAENKAKNGTIATIASIIKTKEDPDIFVHLKPQVKERIISAETKEDYWHKQAKRIREELIVRESPGGQ